MNSRILELWFAICFSVLLMLVVQLSDFYISLVAFEFAEVPMSWSLAAEMCDRNHGRHPLNMPHMPFSIIEKDI